MKIKKIVKDTIGSIRINYIRGFKKYLKHLKSKDQNIYIEDKEHYSQYKMNNRHLFNGYYDLDPLNSDGERLLCLSIPRFADAKKDLAEIGIINIKTNKYERITTSKLWNWQQGSRLRWSTENEDCILYNDVNEQRQVTKKLNVKNGQTAIFCNYPLYDLNEEAKLGVSIDFIKLQQNRPGYGYEKIDLDLAYESNQSALKLIDLNTGSLIREVKYSELYSGDLNNVYINHISISPSGKKVMFFVIETFGIEGSWKASLNVLDIELDSIVKLSDKTQPSHYTWFNDEKLLVTEKNEDNSINYVFYDLQKKSRTVLSPEYLNRDGHPTFISEDIFISDTYPNNQCYQELFLYDISKKQSNLILSAFSDPRFIQEQRCDLHPKIHFSDDKVDVFIDSTFDKGCRSIIQTQVNR